MDVKSRPNRTMTRFFIANISDYMSITMVLKFEYDSITNREKYYRFSVNLAFQKMFEAPTKRPQTTAVFLPQRGQCPDRVRGPHKTPSTQMIIHQIQKFCGRHTLGLTKGGSLPHSFNIMIHPHTLISRIAPLALCFICTPSCMFLPSAGPSGTKILNQAGKETGTPSYQLIPVNDQVIRSIATHSPKAPYLAASGRRSDNLFGQRGIERFGSVNPQAIAIGDVINVAIYETDSSLFGPSIAAGALAVSPMTPLPPQTVDQTGEISVPFVGRVRALGRRTGDIENDIKESLKMKTSDPQVVVTMADRKGGNLVSIAGDVKSPSLVPVSLVGTRLIDAIAAAGGSVSAPYDTMVSVTRGSTTRSEAASA